WSVAVTNAEGKGIPGVEVTLTLSDLVPAEGATESTDADDVTDTPVRNDTETAATEDVDKAGATGETEETEETTAAGEAENAEDRGTSVESEPVEVTVVTGEDGTAHIDATPTGQQPGIVPALQAPAERPYVRDPVTAETQRVVSTGGEQTLTAEAFTSAVPAPGLIRVTKEDSDTGEGSGGVPLRQAGEDKTSPAVDANGAPLVDANGAPLVVTTEGADGVVTVENVRTPQTLCGIEVRPPNGDGDASDPGDPPPACGEVRPGDPRG